MTTKPRIGIDLVERGEVHEVSVALVDGSIRLLGIPDVHFNEMVAFPVFIGVDLATNPSVLSLNQPTPEAGP